MDDIARYIYEQLQLSHQPKIRDYKDRHLSEIKVASTKDMKILGDWIYNDSTIYLTRKKDIYNNFLQYHNFC